MVEIQINEGGKIAVEKVGADLIIDGHKSDHEIIQIDEKNFKVFTKSKIFSVAVLEKDDNQLTLSIDGKSVSVSSFSHIDQILEKLGMNTAASASIKDIKAPMPGAILSLNVEVGSAVSKGDTILILEAMKMENVIKSPGDGKVASILVKQGDNVEKNQLLISLE
ncbi:MAG: acetyl-CoA carboxylase biotin carboxyl carrier protein subunit [Cyclobacteriaceae bacterium]